MTFTPSDEWPPPSRSDSAPLGDSPSWNQTVETMDPADRTRLVVGKLNAQLGHCYEKAGFYRARRGAAGVNPDKISSLDGLSFPPRHGGGSACWAIEEVFT